MNDVEEIKRGRGRPKMEEPCNNVHTLRLDDDEDAKLNRMATEEGVNKSTLMRRALKLCYLLYFEDQKR